MTPEQRLYMTAAIAVAATPGMRGFDTVVNVTGLPIRDAEFAIRYLENVTRDEAFDITTRLGALLGLVTYAEDFDAMAHVAKLKALGYPSGCTVFLDIEGVTVDTPTLVSKINNWGSIIRHAGWDPGLYHGPGALLTSDELSALIVDRYWHGNARCLDRAGREAAPRQGYCMHQLRPGNAGRGQTMVGIPIGLKIDCDVVTMDYLDRVPMFAGT